MVMELKKISIFLILVFSLTNVRCQEVESSRFGLRYTFSYDFELKLDNNFRVMHHIPVCYFRLNAHELYVGPQYSYIIQPTPIANIIYQNNAFGANLGYRYYSNAIIDNLLLFGQFNFSVFRIGLDEYQNGPPFVQTKQKYIVENTASIGVNYQCLPNLNCFLGVGIGSFGGFFLLFDEFNLSNYLGLSYEF
jgi:hypothetical protein